MRPGEPNRTRHREVYGAACFFGGVASPVSIKAHSLHALDQLLNSTSHMPCFMGSVNRRNSKHRKKRNCCSLLYGLQDRGLHLVKLWLRLNSLEGWILV